MIPNDSNRIQTHLGSMDGIFTYIWLILRVNVGKYSSPMDPMGYGIERVYHFFGAGPIALHCLTPSGTIPNFHCVEIALSS